MRVLVVDNEAHLRKLLIRLLNQLGFPDVLEASDGSAAILTLAQTPVDLIVTDLQMPHMDGIGLVRRLRESGDRTPVIMVSGQTDPTLITLAHQVGVDHYLAKPVDGNALSDAIHQTMGSSMGSQRSPLTREMASRKRHRRTA